MRVTKGGGRKATNGASGQRNRSRSAQGHSVQVFQAAGPATSRGKGRPPARSSSSLRKVISPFALHDDVEAVLRLKLLGTDRGVRPADDDLAHGRNACGFSRAQPTPASKSTLIRVMPKAAAPHARPAGRNRPSPSCGAGPAATTVVAGLPGRAGEDRQTVVHPRAFVALQRIESALRDSRIDQCHLHTAAASLRSSCQDPIIGDRNRSGSSFRSTVRELRRPSRRDT